MIKGTILSIDETGKRNLPILAKGTEDKEQYNFSHGVTLLKVLKI